MLKSFVESFERKNNSFMASEPLQNKRRNKRKDSRSHREYKHGIPPIVDETEYVQGPQIRHGTVQSDKSVKFAQLKEVRTYDVDDEDLWKRAQKQLAKQEIHKFKKESQPYQQKSHSRSRKVTPKNCKQFTNTAKKKGNPDPDYLKYAGKIYGDVSTQPKFMCTAVIVKIPNYQGHIIMASAKCISPQVKDMGKGVGAPVIDHAPFYFCPFSGHNILGSRHCGPITRIWFTEGYLHPGLSQWDRSQYSLIFAEVKILSEYNSHSFNFDDGDGDEVHAMTDGEMRFYNRPEWAAMINTKIPGTDTNDYQIL